MRRFRLIQFISFMVLAITVMNINALHACPSCFGDVNSSQQAGLNGAIITLVGLTGFILTSVSIFFFMMVKRTKKLQTIIGDTPHDGGIN